MTNYKISIGMPVFNGEKYIKESIEAILAQTYTDFEFIISDNASTDRTQEICLGYAKRDDRIRYHRNSINLGASPNYNRVFELSTGEYFKWSDADDLISPTFLDECANILNQYPEVILVYSKAKIIDNQGKFVVDYDPEPDLSTVKPHRRFSRVLFTPNLFVQLSGLLRSEILKKIPGYGNYPATDEVLLAELTLHGDFYEIPNRLFSVRMHSEQSTFGTLIPGESQTTFSQRDRILFFDTSKEGKIVLPHWLFILDGLRAIRSAPLSVTEKTYCYAHILRWILRHDHFRALGKDLLIALVNLLIHAFRFKSIHTAEDNTE